MNKILIGIVTRNDVQNFRLLESSLNLQYERFLEVIDQTDFMIVNDGQRYPTSSERFQNIETVQHTSPKNNSACYNNILRKAVNEGYDHIFIVSDTIEILDGGVFDRYIRAAEESGIPLFNFGLSAIPDKKGVLQPNSRVIFNYTPDIGVTLNLDTTSSFSYLHRNVIDKVGFFDERYKSVLEWADYTYRAVEAGYSSPWGWFADIAKSEKYLKLNKSNDNLPGLRARIMHAAGLFKHKFQLLPEQLPQLPLESVKTELKIIKEKNLVPVVLESFEVISQ